MLLTKEKIDKMANIWDTDIYELKNSLDKNNVQIIADQETIKYLLIRFCELRNELDNAIENSFAYDL